MSMKGFSTDPRMMSHLSLPSDTVSPQWPFVAVCTADGDELRKLLTGPPTPEVPIIYIM